MHSWSTDLLFCLEFVEITKKIETVGDLAVGKNKYILFCARFASTVTLRARSHALDENNSLQKITVCNEVNSKFD